MDERNVGLRATWHHDRGFANLSVWRGERCEETFHLRTADAPQLIAFLAEGLGEAAAAAMSEPAPVVAPPRTPVLRLASVRARDEVTRVRRRLAGWMEP